MKQSCSQLKIAGVDEAGRGSVIGPLVIAGVVVEEETLPTLKALGVKDSKLLSPNRRKQLENEIKKIVLQFHLVRLSPAEIDLVVQTKGKLRRLNRLEAHTMARVIWALKPDIAYVDASDVLAGRFREHIEERLPCRIKIISEHKADFKYPIVSAASILAKVERDRAIQELGEKFGAMGIGYPTDPKTMKFLAEWISKYGSYPDFVRKSWKPAQAVKEKAEATQTRLV